MCQIFVLLGLQILRQTYYLMNSSAVEYRWSWVYTIALISYIMQYIHSLRMVSFDKYKSLALIDPLSHMLSATATPKLLY